MAISSGFSPIPPLSAYQPPANCSLIQSFAASADSAEPRSGCSMLPQHSDYNPFETPTGGGEDMLL